MTDQEKELFERFIGNTKTILARREECERLRAENERLREIMERQNEQIKKLGIRIHKMKNKVFYATSHARQVRAKLRRAGIEGG